MTPTNKQKLFIVSGASGVGKSTACELLFKQETDYIVLESDLLWNDMYNTPEDEYFAYRKLWLNLCANVSQIGLPVVLCGCAIPSHFEEKDERELFSQIHYVAIVSEFDKLDMRMRDGRNISDEGHLKSSADFNEWLKENAKNTNPHMHLIDNSYLTAEQTAEQIDKFIRSKL